MKRTQISTGVSGRTRQQANELTDAFGYSLRDVVSIAIDRMHQDEISVRSPDAVPLKLLAAAMIAQRKGDDFDTWSKFVTDNLQSKYGEDERRRAWQRAQLRHQRIATPGHPAGDHSRSEKRQRRIEMKDREDRESALYKALQLCLAELDECPGCGATGDGPHIDADCPIGNAVHAYASAQIAAGN